MTAPLRYGTDSKGRSRPLCQALRRHDASCGPAGEPCARYATQESASGLFCANHVEGAQERAAARAREAVARRRPGRKRPPRPDVRSPLPRCSCGCTSARPCRVLLPGGKGLGRCAPAGSQPWLTSCSACMTPELRASEAEARAWDDGERREVTAAFVEPDGLPDRAAVGMTFRVYFAFGCRSLAEAEDYLQDRSFRLLESACVFSVGTRKQGGVAVLRYEASRRFDNPNAPEVPT